MLQALEQDQGIDIVTGKAVNTDEDIHEIEFAAAGEDSRRLAGQTCGCAEGRGVSHRYRACR